MKVYDCDPAKNVNCKKNMCYLHGGPCSQTLYKEFAMENEIRYYLRQLLACMEPEDNDTEDVFVPQYIVTAVKLPTGAVELAVNNSCIKEKIKYILEAYDENMHLKTNNDIVMQNVMVV